MGLCYYRARYYSPRFQRFVSEDPAGIAGGINAYAYAGNSPVNFRDPFGLKPNRCQAFYCSPVFWGGLALAAVAPEALPLEWAAGAEAAAEAAETAEAAEATAEAEEAVTGFRAVSEPELYDINDTGQFNLQPGGQVGKSFFNTEGQAWDFGNRFYGEGNFGVVQGDFPPSVPVEPFNVGTEGPGFWVPGSHLPFGSPTIIWP